MTARKLVAFGLVASLAACSNGVNLNPLTWFSAFSNDPGLVTLEPDGGWREDQDHRLVISQVESLKIERTTAGAIVHATGLAPRLGYWDAELVPENDGFPDDKGVMSYVFRIAEPRWNQGTGTAYTRRIQVAQFLSTADLRDIRRIVVKGERNSLSSRR